MRGKLFVFMAILFCSNAMVDLAVAQNLLQRLGQQLTQQVPPPPPAVDTLPPPRNPVPANNSGRPTLGIRVGPVTDEVIREQRLVVRRGAVITAIEKGSAADRAGLPLRGVIVALNGRRIDTPDDIILAMQTVRPGQEVDLTYYDHEKLARKKVPFAGTAAPEAVAIPSEPARPNFPAPITPAPGPATNLERDLGGDGCPILGRLGRVIDGLAAPSQPVVPAEHAAPVRGDLETEVIDLRQQLAELTKQVESLRKQVTSLEKKLEQK